MFRLFQSNDSGKSNPLSGIEKNRVWNPDAQERLRDILARLSSNGSISHDRVSVVSANLNLGDKPRLADIVPELSQTLYHQVREAGISYDAVTSCPTGGDAWAEAFAAQTKADGRDVSFYRLNKVDRRKFSVIDGQPVSRGAGVIVADDTIYEGRTSAAAVKVLEKAGFKIAGLVFPVEIGLSGRRYWEKRGIPIFSVYNNATVKALSGI